MSAEIKVGFGEYHMKLLEKTAQTAKQIKVMIDLDSTLTQHEIAERLGVSRNTVGKIIRKLRDENETV